MRVLPPHPKRLAGQGLPGQTVAGRRANTIPSDNEKLRNVIKDACAKVSPRTLNDVSEQSPEA